MYDIKDKLWKENLITESKFGAYFIKNNLIYYRKGCTSSDTKDVFYLHIVPQNIEDISKVLHEYGFQNMDFDWKKEGIPGRRSLHRKGGIARVFHQGDKNWAAF
ncbi:MAG: hypothetical protein ABIB41_00050 [Nitrospirota bacterium]